MKKVGAFLLIWLSLVAAVGATPARIQGTGDTAHAMGVSYDGVNTTTGTLTFPAAVGSGNTVVGTLGGSLSAAGTVVSVVDDKGNTYNIETAVGVAAQFIATSFSRSNITNAPTILTITVTSTGNAVGLNAVAEEWSGILTAATDERDGTAHGCAFQTSPGTGTNGVTSGPFTTTASGDLLYTGTINNNIFGNLVLTPGTTTSATYAAGITSAFTAFSNLQINSAWATQSTAGASTAGNWTQTQNDARETCMIAIKASAAGPSGGTKRSLTGVGN